VGDALAVVGLAVSLGIGLVSVVVVLMIARIRRVSKRNSDLEEVREMNVAAMGYIFRVELAIQEACHRLGTEPDWAALDKPEILKRSFLARKAQDEGNKEIAELVAIVSQLQEQLKGTIPQLPTKE
jgi:hypothetical protein